MKNNLCYALGTTGKKVTHPAEEGDRGEAGHHLLDRHERTAVHRRQSEGENDFVALRT